MASGISPLLQQLNARVSSADVIANGVLSTVFTLDYALSLWAYKAIQDPGRQLQGVAPYDAAVTYAQRFCAWAGPPDCAQMDTLVPIYAGIVEAAAAGAPIPPFPPIPVKGPPTVTTGTGYPSPPAVDPNAYAATVAAAIAAAPQVAQAPAPTTPGVTPPAASTVPTTTTNPAAGVAVTPSGPTPKFILAAGGALLSGAGLGVSAATAAVTFGISIVATVVASLFMGLFGGSDTKALQQAINQLRQAQAQIADELERFSWSIANGLGRLWQAIAEIWDNFLDALWNAIKRLWNLLWTVVSQVIPKMIQVMRDLRKFLDSIYLKYILPAMRYLRYVRQVLTILRALHVPIAARLDKILSQIQGALYLPLYSLARIVGGYGAWINVILTNRYTIQRGVFLRTMYTYQGDWINLWWAAQASGLATSTLPSGVGAGVPSNDAAVLAEQNLYLSSGTGPMAADVAQAQSMTDAALAGSV